ncbi:hypothetical protein [Streptomyces cinereoruber]|uniref:hypothetical protein n=1 Tax=Streptomyces cinereoruber TaxID=67260 RepID=UPI003C2E84CD
MAEQQDGGDRDPQPIDEEAAWAAIVAGYGEEPADPPGTKPFRPIENLSLPEPEDLDGDGDGTGTGSGGAPAPKAAGKPDAAWKPRTAGRPEAEDGPGNDGAASGTSGGGASGAGTSGSGGSGNGASAAGGRSGAAEKAGAGEEPEADGTGAGPEKPALGGSIVFAPGVRPAGPRDYSPAEPEDGPAGSGGSDEGHFVPPEPPPLPEADAAAKFAWLGVVGGPVLMLVAVLLQWDMTWWLTTLCVGGFLGGFATLVARMKHDDEDDDGFDDPGRGAVV